MSDKVYFHLQFFNVTDAEEELLALLCFDHGAGGVSEELDFVQTRDDYQPEIVEKNSKTMNGFFEEMPSEDFFLKLATEFPNITVEKNEEKNRDWLEEWKKGFKAFPLAGPYWVVPSWLEKPEQAEKPIWIDPGMAFGTGTHATTQMASELLIDWTQDKKDFTVLDVGTGTGILAFLAEKQGASRVVGTEIDEDARRVARENADKNQCKVEIPDQQIDSLSETYDLVIANIIGGILQQIKGDLFARMKPGGQLLLSGILIEHEKEFFEEFLQSSKLKVTRRLEKEEWIAVLLA